MVSFFKLKFQHSTVGSVGRVCLHNCTYFKIRIHFSIMSSLSNKILLTNAFVNFEKGNFDI